MMKALVAATLLALSVLPAHAGQVQNWANLPANGNIPVACLTDFDTSDDAFRACRTPSLTSEYREVYANMYCKEYERVTEAKARLQKMQLTTKKWKEALQAKGTEPTSEEEDKSRAMFIAERKLLRDIRSMWEPAPERVAILDHVCNGKVWIAATLDKELTFLHHVAK